VYIPEATRDRGGFDVFDVVALRAGGGATGGTVTFAALGTGGALKKDVRSSSKASALGGGADAPRVSFSLRSRASSLSMFFGYQVGECEVTGCA
jgi:hypothetical protein